MLSPKLFLLLVVLCVHYAYGQDNGEVDYTVLKGQAISKMADQMFNPKKEPLPPRNCDVVCTAEYDPVCGFSWCDGFLTFGNRCAIYAHNSCQSTYYTYLFHGRCEDVFGYICIHEVAEFEKKKK